MSGLTIEQELAGGVQGENIEGAGDMHAAAEMEPAAPARRFDFSFLKAKTGPGSVEEYIQHPLNFNESRAVARVLRGVTGMFDALDYAIIDIGVGLMDYVRGKRSGADKL